MLALFYTAIESVLSTVFVQAESEFFGLLYVPKVEPVPHFVINNSLENWKMEFFVLTSDLWGSGH